LTHTGWHIAPEYLPLKRKTERGRMAAFRIEEPEEPF
jgi:hypothetical protein